VLTTRNRVSGSCARSKRFGAPLAVADGDVLRSFGRDGEDVVERCGELAVPVADQEVEAPGPFAKVHEQIAGLLGCRRASRMAVTPRMCTARVWISHHKQDVQALQQRGIDVQEVTGKDA
jgi:hypothetical protein